MEAAGFSETLTPTKQPTWHQISEDSLVNQIAGV